VTKLEELERLKDALKTVSEIAYKASVAAFNASEDADDAYDAVLRAYKDELEKEADQ
jgi:hypothetical protein|tara:strand:+ start:197 stop:367 length:171 start_codon:yes stop_codon:yes gene_type:complete